MSQSMNEIGSWKRIELDWMNDDLSLRCYVELHGNTVCESWSQRKSLCKLVWKHSQWKFISGPLCGGIRWVVHKGIHWRVHKGILWYGNKRYYELYSYIEVRRANMGECQESVRADRCRWSERVRETWLSCNRCWKSVGIGTRWGFVVRMRERKLWSS